MIIDVDEGYHVVLRQVYHPVIVRDESGGGVSVCERDGRIEVVQLSASQRVESPAICRPCMGRGRTWNRHGLSYPCTKCGGTGKRVSVR